MTQEYSTWRIWLLLFFAVALQTTWLSRIEPGGAHIDLPLLCTTSVALILGWQFGAVYGLAAGIITGFCAGAGLGSFAVSRLAAGATFAFFDKGFSRDNPVAPPLCAVGAVVLSNFVFLVMSPLDFSLTTWVQLTVARSLAHAVLIWPVHIVIRHFVLQPTRTSLV